MDLRRLRYFLAVAEDLHFGRAAARLGLAQPPLSQQIRALEAAVGAPLFERSSRRVALTPAGAALIGPARAALAAAAAGLEAARRAARGEGEPVVIGFLHSLAYTLLPRLLPAFRDRHPAVPVALMEMDAAQQCEALSAGRVDVGLLRPPIGHPAVETAPLLAEPFVVALPAGHALAGRRRITPLLLDGAAMVLYPPEAPPQGFAQVLRPWFDAHGILPCRAQEARTLHTAVGLVAAGIGLALVPASVGRLGVRGVVFRPLAAEPPQAEVWLAWRRGEKAAGVLAFRRLAADLLPGPRGGAASASR